MALSSMPGTLSAPRLSRAPGRPAPTAALVLADGTVFAGQGLGAAGVRVGEVCFNTAMTGYQEVLTDPSYAGQIITFTFPHIGITGANDADQERERPAALGLVLRAPAGEPSNQRAERRLHDWLAANRLPGISGIDTRRLTRRIRELGAPSGALCHAPDGRLDLAALQRQASAWPGLAGMDLALTVSCRQSHVWEEGGWAFADDGAGGWRAPAAPRHHVVAIDYGAKRNILRCLADAGCRVTVMPADAGADEILAHRPDGIFLSNGPGDPAATGAYAVPTVRALIEAGKPVFGICLGHQILALALGARTAKMHRGHRGANHPVKDLATGKVEITSQNHGFVVTEEGLPPGLLVTHRSLFDGSIEGLAVEGRPVFSVQYHPEASPGPRDSHYLFRRFTAMLPAGA